MNVKQFYLDCLAHASYLVVDERTHEAVVIDPQRDVEQYIEEAQRQGAKITTVVLTHFHADFVAGHLELRDRVGAEVCLGAAGKAEFEHRALHEGDVLQFGDSRLEVLETPGHTPEGISLVAYSGGSAEPEAVFTGDTLFAGDVGRPDLFASFGVTAEELASLLYDSLHDKLLTLPDATVVFPAHGAGSMCGKNLSADPRSTIGNERAHNASLQPMTRQEFIDSVSEGQPDAPAYFGYDAVMNRKEHDSLSVRLETGVPRRSLEETLRLKEDGAQLVDVRDASEFAEGHLSGSLSIGLDGKFATWAGTFLDPAKPIVIIAPPGRELEAVMRLGRIGYEAEVSLLDGGPEAFAAVPEHLKRFERMGVDQLAAQSDEQRVLVDVRSPREYETGHIIGSRSLPLNQLVARKDELPRDRIIDFVCRTGYRSAVAVSLLEGVGFTQLRDVEGGMVAWNERGLPVEAASACASSQGGGV